MQQLCKTIAVVLQVILQNVCNRFAKSLQNSCIHIKSHQTCFCMILQTIRNAAWGTVVQTGGPDPYPPLTLGFEIYLLNRPKSFKFPGFTPFSIPSPLPRNRPDP